MKKYVIFFNLLCVISGCSTLPHSIKTGTDSSDAEKNNQIFVINHGWHTGVAVPASELTRALPELGQRFPDSNYLEIGWGDEGYYQAEKITLTLTVSALFWPTDSVLHIVSVPVSPETLFPDSKIFRLSITDNELQHLLEFIKSSFYLSKNEMIKPLKTGIYGDSQFYRAVGDFFVFNTCNTWTSKALESSGLNLPDDVLILTAKEITQLLEKY